MKDGRRKHRSAIVASYGGAREEDVSLREVALSAAHPGAAFSVEHIGLVIAARVRDRHVAQMRSRAGAVMRVVNVITR
ncbi:MAG: hypothetical protein QM820_29835 [Minicystis sp.]